MDRFQTNNTLILTDFIHTLFSPTCRVASFICLGWWQISKVEKNCNWFKPFEMSWLYSQSFTFHWKLLVLVSRIQKSATGDNNFGKWKGTFRSDWPKWPDRSLMTTFKAGPEYSGRTKPKWSVPFDEPTEISGIWGWMESALSLCCALQWKEYIFISVYRNTQLWNLSSD